MSTQTTPRLDVDVLRQVSPRIATASPAGRRRAGAALAVLALSGWAGGSPARAATASVGTDFACTHSSLAAAIAWAQSADDGPHRIRLSSGTYRERTGLAIREPMAIVGGYPSCGSPQNSGSRPVVELDVLDAYLQVAPPVDGPRVAFRLENVNLVGVARFPAGVTVHGPVDATVEGLGLESLSEGGISVISASGRRPTLAVNPSGRYYSWWHDNGAYANHGGALYCGEGAVTLRRVSFEANNSNGNGGAIGLLDCDLAIGAGVSFKRNRARYRGGAIAAEKSSSVETFEGPHVWIDNNFAASGGFLSARASTVRFREVVVTAGFIGSGSTVHLYDGADFELVSATRSCPTPVLGFCGYVGATATTGRGGALLVESSTARLYGVLVGSASADAGGGAIHLENGQLALENVAIVDNQGPSILSVVGDSATRLSMRYVTMTANRASLAPLVVEAVGGSSPQLEMLSSILWEPQSPVLIASVGGTLVPDVDCLLASSTFPGQRVLVGEDPQFVDLGLDFHLAITSPAIDFCDVSRTGTAFADQDGELRGTDQPGVSDRGPGATFDLGFDEVFGGPAILFADGFESGDTTRWEP